MNLLQSIVLLLLTCTLLSAAAAQECVDICPDAAPVSGSAGVSGGGPGGVSNIVVRERLTTSATLEWQEEGSTMSYTVQFRTQGSTDDFVSLRSTPLTNLTIEGLTPGTSYEAQVCTANGTTSSNGCGGCLLCFSTLPSQEIQYLCKPPKSLQSVTISEVEVTATDQGRGISIGENTSLVCEATTTARPLELNITWFRAENGSDVQLFQNGDNFNITMETQNTTTNSTLTIRVTGMEDYTEYFCLANSGNSTEMSNGTVTIRRPGLPDPPDLVTLSVAAIVAIAFSGPILILLVTVIVVPAGCYCYYHKKIKKSVHEVVAPLRSKRWDLEESFPDESTFNGTVKMKSETVSVLRSQLPQQMLIANEQIQVLRVVGQGEFGVVYKAILRRADGASELVAVKTLKGLFSKAGDVQNLAEEVLKMQHFHHPNVMALVGVSVECNAGGPCVIMPFMAKGSLLHYLRQEAETLKPSKETDVTQVGAVQKLLLKMCLQIAKGMEYLASMKFVHRDLAARNCMIGVNNNVKVADFGLTEDIYTKSYYRQDTSDTSIRLPLKWMALESIKLGVFSEKTDMWSFGVTCWEVFSAGEIPYPSLHPRQVLNMLEEGERMERPRNAACSDDFYTLMLECWNADPQTRPSFADTVVRLDSLLELVAEYLDISIVVTNNRDSDTAVEESEPAETPNLSTVVRLDSLLESVAKYLDISIVVTNNRDSDTAVEKSEPAETPNLSTVIY